ncbi:MAG TPA: hypothetical protein VMM77_12285 [Gemmatimonadaceae bacterium]|nr:hypothetical protein [Gemmatimonadaceae bacterium]
MPAPVQAPLQPVNAELLIGCAVSVTAVPLVKDAVQTEPQSMPAGVEVTVPTPVPVVITLSVNCGSVNVAVTLRAWFIKTWHVPVPAHAPIQPVNSEPLAGCAVNVTTVPLLNDALHAEPHVIPAGVDVTVPLPLPSLVTVSVNC